MRRAIASLLLAFFSFLLIAPALPAKAASDLPTCCRRNGKHHCAGADMADQQDLPTAPSVKAVQAKCPLFPKTAGIPALSSPLLLGILTTAALPHSVRTASEKTSENHPHVAFVGLIRQRGPPSKLD